MGDRRLFPTTASMSAWAWALGWKGFRDFIGSLSFSFVFFCFLLAAGDFRLRALLGLLGFVPSFSWRDVPLSWSYMLLISRARHEVWMDAVGPRLAAQDLKLSLDWRLCRSHLVQGFSMFVSPRCAARTAQVFVLRLSIPRAPCRSILSRSLKAHPPFTQSPPAKPPRP